MRLLDHLATLAVVTAIPCGTIAWFTLDVRLMGVALGLATVAAGLGMWVRWVEVRG